jgi:hypothetical protein
MLALLGGCFYIAAPHTFNLLLQLVAHMTRYPNILAASVVGSQAVNTLSERQPPLCFSPHPPAR